MVTSVFRFQYTFRSWGSLGGIGMWGIITGSQRMKDYSDVAFGMNYGVIFVIPKHTLGELEGP